MAKLVITNTSGGKFSLDLKVMNQVLRASMSPGGTYDVSNLVSADDLNTNADCAALVAAGKISVTESGASTDTPEVNNRASMLFMGQPALAASNTCAHSANVANGALSLNAQPDVPRNVTAAVTDSDSDAIGTLTVVGKDMQGRAITETMHFNAGTGLTFTGTKCFASVTSATLSGVSGNGDSDASIVVGYGTVVGLPHDLKDTSAVVLAWLGGGTPASSPTVTAGASTSGIDLSSGTYDGSKIMSCLLNPSL